MDILSFLPLALEGHWADWRGVGALLIAILVLGGSIYMLLWSNFGARVGYLISMVSLSSFMILFSLVWLVGAPGTAPGTGPRAGGPSTNLAVAGEPEWVPFLPDSEQGKEFADAIARFPQGWDEPGKIYPGNIDSQGELDRLKTTIAEALARLAEEQKLDATNPEDWHFRPPGSEALTPEEQRVPEARSLRYYQAGDSPLLFGVTIPSTDDHREVTVFAFRDKGRIFLYSLYFLIASVLLFVSHVWLLARHEEREKARTGDQEVALA